jgi:hypothetical protein
MKKMIIPIAIILLAACNSNNPSGAGVEGPADSTRTMTRDDSTATTNNQAYNTTDTGASKGGLMDSSGEHTISNRNKNKDSAH